MEIICNRIHSEINRVWHDFYVRIFFYFKVYTINLNNFVTYLLLSLFLYLLPLTFYPASVRLSYSNIIGFKIAFILEIKDTLFFVCKFFQKGRNDDSYDQLKLQNYITFIVCLFKCKVTSNYQRKKWLSLLIVKRDCWKLVRRFPWQLILIHNVHPLLFAAC